MPTKDFLLGKTQQARLRDLLDLICSVEAGSVMLNLACRFRKDIDWSKVTATYKQEQRGSNTYHINLVFPLGHNVKGYLRLHFWQLPASVYSLGASASDTLDFAVHKYSEGELWASLGHLFDEVRSAAA